jgi:glutathione S-transferase
MRAKNQHDCRDTGEHRAAVQSRVEVSTGSNMRCIKQEFGAGCLQGAAALDGQSRVFGNTTFRFCICRHRFRRNNIAKDTIMVTLYGVYRSRASRPIWLLGEIGMEFTHVPVIQGYRLPDPQAAGSPLNTTSPAYLSINPQGQIPCMTDGDLTLTESLAITLYVAMAYGGALGPKDTAETALMTQWALHAVSAVEGPAVEILYARVDYGQTVQADDIVANAAEKLRRPFARLDAHLAAHPYLVGDRFTVADINTAECVRYAQGHPAAFADFPALTAWLDKVQARPAFAAMWAKRMSEPA